MTHYTYKGNVYELVGECQLKNGGDWIPAIVYKNRDGDLFCREFVDFHAKFKPVNINLPEWYYQFYKS